MDYPYNQSGPSFSNKRRRFSNGVDDHDQSRYNSSPPRERIMSSNQYSRGSPSREAQYSALTSYRPGGGRWRESRSPHGRSPIRDRPREFDREYDRFDNRDRRPRSFIDNSYPNEYFDRGSVRTSPQPRSAQPGGSSRHTSMAGSPFHDQYPTSKKDLAHDRPAHPHIDTSSEIALTPIKETLNYAEAAKDFGLLLIKLVDGGADLCALKIQKTAAAKEFDKKDKDYKKSKDHHAKFPAVEESQKKSRDRAEEALKSMSDLVNSKDEELKGLAIQSATHFVPSIIHAGGSNSSAFQERVKELDKKCENLQRQVEDQKRYIEEEKKARVELAKKYDMQAAQLSSLTGSIDNFKASEHDIKDLKDDLSAVTKVTSGLPQDLKQAFDSLSSRVDTFNNLSLQVTKGKEDYAKLNRALVESSKTVEGYSKKVTECESKVSALHIAISGGMTISSITGSAKQLLPNDVNLISEVKKLKDANLPGSVLQLQQKVTALETQVKAIGRQSPSKSAASASISGVDSDISRSVLLRLDTLEGKIEDFPDLDERVVTTSMFENINKEVNDIRAAMLSANAKETIDHDDKLSQRVYGIEENQKSTMTSLRNLNNLGLKSRLGALENDLQAISQGQTTLQQKVLSLENEQTKLSNIGQLMTNLQNDVSLSKEISSKSKFTSIETRLGVLEQHPRANADSLAPVNEAALGTPPTAIVDITALKDELKQIVEVTQAASDGAMAEILEQLNSSVKSMGGRCTIVEQRLSDMEAELEPIKKLPTTVESVQRSVNAHSISFQTVDASLKGLETSTEQKVVTLSVNKTLDAIRAQPYLLPLESIEARVFQNIDGQLNVKMNNYATSSHEINQVMNNHITSVEQRVEASEFNIGNLDKRMHNINSKDMGSFIMSQLDAIYPHVRHCQDTLAKMTSAMKLNKNNIENLFQALKDLQNRPNTVDDKFIDLLKTKLEDLDREVTKAQSAATTALGDVNSIRAEQDQSQKDIATELAMFQMDVDDMKKSVNDLRNSRRSAPPASHTAPLASIASMQAPPSNRLTAASLAHSISNGRSHSGIGTVSMNQRSASIQSDASTAKRRRGNRSISSGSPPKAINGNIKSRKRHKDKHPRDDDTDSEFEPMQPQITHSDDED